ncbi:hypothetical protein [Eubacterium xylanophilum]|uniref:hypothetical protein n=1 Tax=Eubacterium xylanophilum TaxID=39497 RepID=UPI00047D8DF5|nr:hypothetical protein [Eubacterium xylanophilum]
MALVKSIKEIVNINENYRNSINLYLDLNKEEKIESYLPTSSSLSVLNDYVEAIDKNVRHSTVLIGPYGKGKSILLLVMMALISMDNNDTVKSLIKRIKEVDSNVAKTIERVRKNGKYLPIIVMGSQDDLNQTFMVALNDALKREGVQDIMPETYYSCALDSIEKWKKGYKETYNQFIEFLKIKKLSPRSFANMLKKCDKDALDMFRDIYPKLTSGSDFNPLVGGDVIAMYKSVTDSLKEEYGYAGVYIIFDEFSKYIESQDKELAGNNMKVIQDLCELANDSDKSNMYFTLVAHKSIKEYGNHLSKEIINAYTGIEGRISEVYFTTSAKNSYELIQNAINCDTNKLDSLPVAKTWFSEDKIIDMSRLAPFSSFTEDDFERIVYKGCYPLTPIATYSLLNISEKVAQNERTLFTFISNDEVSSLRRFITNQQDGQWYVSPDVVYDYFKNIFKKDIDNEYVHNEWINADFALKKAENEDQKKILKLIALINIINNPDELSATADVLTKYSMALEASEALEQLERNKIIYKKASTGSYTFKTRAGIELKKELKVRRKNSANTVEIFENISEMQYVFPKQYNYDYCMTRYFRSVYMDVAEFMGMNDVSVIFNNGLYQDGMIVYLYRTNSDINNETVLEKIKEVRTHNIVFVIASVTLKEGTLKSIINYEALQSIKSDSLFMKENEVLNNELELMIDDVKADILSFISRAFGARSKAHVVYYNGIEWIIDNKIKTEKAVDVVCKRLYSKTLIIKNEMINKQFVTTSPIKKARKTIIAKLLNHESCEEYLKGTAPEATIYRAVLENTGTTKNSAQSDIVERFDEFIESCVDQKKKLSGLVDIYCGEQYGMRMGVFPIILAYKLSKRPEDIIIYHNDKEIKLDENSVVDMAEKSREYSIFISRSDNEKENYLTDLSELFDVKNGLNLSGNRITNILTCMQRWYRSLPQVTKNIKKPIIGFDNQETVAFLPKLRDYLQAFETNPYELLLDKLPSMIGKGDFSKTVDCLRELKNSLDKYYNLLEKHVIERTREVFSKDSKETMIHALKDWYEKQSYNAKHSIHSSSSTEMMNYINGINNYNEPKVVQNLSKIVSGAYIDVWNDETFEEYDTKLRDIKKEIESIGDENNGEESRIVFEDSDGNEIDSILYRPTEDGSVFKSILEDHLEDFEDLDVNTKVAVLVEMINKVTKRER